MTEAAHAAQAQPRKDKEGQGTRGPQQMRSRASLERMIKAARKLMIERNGEDFTLQEVSLRGKVSIGSIYHRFGSKDELVRAVIGEELAEVAASENAVFRAACDKSSSLDEYVPAYVAAFASILRDNALMLKLTMRRASTDSEVSQSGETHEQASVERLAEGLRTFADEISGDVETKAYISFDIVFATLARHLSLDSNDPLTMRRDWDTLISELSRMVLAYLKA